MTAMTISLISAITALVAALIGPVVTLVVARRQFSATVLSANRQRWIESLRENLAELISQVVGVMVVKAGRKDSWNENFEAASRDPDLVRRIERIALLQWKLRLLLNPAKPAQAALAAATEALLERLKQPGGTPQETRAAVEEITLLTQTIVMNEWERVKKGV